MGFVVRHRWWLVVVVPYLYGFLTGLIPSPDDVGQFWVADLAAPYVVLPLVAAWLLRDDSALVRLLLVPGATVAMVLGFYRLHAVGWSLSPSQLDLLPSASRAELWWASQQLWWRTFTLGGTPWVSITLVLGVLLVLVTWRSGERAWFLTWLGSAALFVLEPLVYTAGFNPFVEGGRETRTARNVLIWMCVALVDSASLMVLLRRGRSHADGSEMRN